MPHLTPFKLIQDRIVLFDAAILFQNLQLVEENIPTTLVKIFIMQVMVKL